jgi:hypothetical protein
MMFAFAYLNKLKICNQSEFVLRLLTKIVISDDFNWHFHVLSNLKAACLLMFWLGIEIAW